MTIWTETWGRLMAAYQAFREPSLIADPLHEEDFADFDSRRLRYTLYWSFYENTAYRDVHSWSELYKTKFGLYKYVRNIYNPAYRLAEFWKAHIWGGALDDAAGDGERIPSALPIQTENDALRAAIAQLWQWSNWSTQKDIITLHGAAMGDVGIQIVDDIERGKVYLKVVHPATIKSVTRDPFGHIKAYTFEETRADPRHSRDGRTVIYTETAERDGDSVVYRTYLDGQPYAWNGQREEWEEVYGFIPLVIIQHNNVGLDWGWAEMHPLRSKIHEVDDLSALLHDQIRKSSQAKWLATGIAEPKKEIKPTATASTVYRPEPDREEERMYYAKEGARITPFVAPLDIVGVAAEIKAIIEEMERDYPELQMDIWNAGSNESGRALRIARQRTETKAQARRANYDSELVRAQQMAIAIGGYRGYGEEFRGFGLDSYAAGQLDHQIGKRSVFATDPLDDLEIELTFWQAANTAMKAGFPLAIFLARQGWSEAAINEFMTSPERQAAMAQMQLGLNDMRQLNEAGNG